MHDLTGVEAPQGVAAPGGPMRHGRPIRATRRVDALADTARVTPPPPVTASRASAPTVAPAVVTPAPVGGALTHRILGGEAGYAHLASPDAASRVGQLAALEQESELLPELEGDVAPRKLWRQPAFIVSVGAALVMVVALVIVLLVQGALRGPDKVENLSITDTGSQYFLQWGGPNVPYSVIMTGSGAPHDISVYIKDGRTLWVPKSIQEVDGDSCFVVRSQKAATEDPSTKTDVISRQGGQSICVSDAKAEK